MKIQIKLDKQAIKKIEKAVHKSAVEAMKALHKDLNDSQTVPFDTGNMQNNQTFVCDESDDDKKIYVRLDNSADQSRYLYYGKLMVDAENGSAWARKDTEKVLTEKRLTFQKGRTDHWLEPYLTGNKKDFIRDEFEKNLKGKI